MTISKYRGVQDFPYSLTAASQLMERRVVKISSAEVPSYATYGEVATHYTTQRGDENDYEVAVMPFDWIKGTMFLDLAGTVAADAPLFVTGAVGKVKTYTAIAGGATYTVQSRSLDLDASPSSGDTYIVPSNATQIATWNASGDITGAVYGDVVYYDGSNWKCASDGTTAITAGAATPTAGDVYYVADEGIFVIWSGTAWVEAPILAYAGEAGVSGGYVACYRNKNMGQVSIEQLDSGVRPAVKLICTAQVTAANTDTSTVYHNDQVLATDFAFVQSAEDATNALTELTAVCTADTVTITHADPGASGATFNILVVRAAS